MSERFYPTEESLGKNCFFWQQLGELGLGCTFPKAELQGRTSCEGIVDDVCLWVKDGRPPKSITREQWQRIKASPPNPKNLPPGIAE
jgi:hypothetical protein